MLLKFKLSIISNKSDEIARNIFKSFVNKSKTEFFEEDNDVIEKLIRSQKENNNFFDYEIDLQDQIEEAYEVVNSFYYSIQEYNKISELTMKAYIIIGNDLPIGNFEFYTINISNSKFDLRYFFTEHFVDYDTKCSLSVISYFLNKKEFLNIKSTDFNKMFKKNENKVVHLDEDILPEPFELNENIIFQNITENNYISQKNCLSNINNKIDNLIEQIELKRIIPSKSEYYIFNLTDLLFKNEKISKVYEEELLNDSSDFSLFSKVESEITNRIIKYLKDNHLVCKIDENNEMYLDNILDIINEIL